MLHSDCSFLKYLLENGHQDYFSQLFFFYMTAVSLFPLIQLEILVNVPDALSMIEPEDVLCHSPEFQGPEKEVPVPPEHQLGVFTVWNTR